jgi:hypothetical protein
LSRTNASAIIRSRTIEVGIDDDETGDAAPAEADFEKPQPIREGDRLIGGESFFEDYRENAGRTGKRGANTRGRGTMAGQRCSTF